MYDPCHACGFSAYNQKRCAMNCKYGAAIKALENQKPVSLSIVQLQKMAEEASDLTQEIPDRWIWIEILHHNPQDNRSPASSAFYQVYADHTKGKFFCCGHPGRIYGLSYNEYGENWLAYAVQPK